MIGTFFLMLLMLPGAGQEPQVALKDGGRLALGLPKDLVDDPEIRAQLETGLTTTMILAVQARSGDGRRLKGGARIDIRFEPWDEVYELRVWHVSGKQETLKVDSLEGLRVWMAGYHLTVLRLDKAGSTGWKLNVELQVLPFSKLEQSDTQRWFANTLSNRPGDTRSRGLIDLVFSASLKRKTTRGFDWKVEFRP